MAEMVRYWEDEGAKVTVITAMPNRPEGRIHRDYRRKLFLEERWGRTRVLRSWLFARPHHSFFSTVLNNLTFMATGAAHSMVRGRDIDILIASSPPFFVHVAGDAARRVRRIPLVLEVRDLWPDYLRQMGFVKNERVAGWLFSLESFLFRQAEAVVTVTESFRKRVAGKGVERNRIHVIPNGVDSSFYGPGERPATLDGLNAATPGGFLVGYLGNFGAGQGLSRVLEAALLVRQGNPAVRFVLAGDGPERDALVQHEAVTSGVVRVLSTIPKAKTPTFYAACDACLVPLAPFPILRETVPSKLFEILASEKPVVASVAGEAARIVRASGGGLVARPGDPVSIAETVLRIAAMAEDARTRMGTRGRAYVVEHYERRTLALRYLDVLHDTAAGDRSTRR